MITYRAEALTPVLCPEYILSNTSKPILEAEIRDACNQNHGLPFERRPLIPILLTPMATVTHSGS